MEFEKDWARKESLSSFLSRLPRNVPCAALDSSVAVESHFDSGGGRSSVSEETVPQPANESTSVSDRTSCNTCGATFSDVISQRAHFKSDWHRYNLKLKAMGKPCLSEEQTEEALNNAEDMESLSGSESEDDSSQDEEGQEELQEGDDRVVDARSRFIGILVDKSKEGGREDREIGWVAKAVAMGVKGEGLDLQSLRDKPKWIVLLHRAGHFAGVVVENGTKVVASKSFHRYVVRKKQGKSQSSNDKANGKAKSAGAQIRRYNEAMLKEEIGDLLDKWREHLAQSSRVFVSISRQNQHLFFQHEKLLHSKDPRVRRVPFATRRPTVKEAGAVACKLATVYVQPESDYQASLQAAANQERELLERKQAKRKSKPASESPVTVEQDEETPPEVPQDPIEVREFFQACESGALDKMIMSIAQTPDIVLQHSIVDGCGPLHFAATGGHAKAISFLLENGASPMIRDFRGRCPYHCATSKACRDAFRVFWAQHPDKWDYEKAGIPSPLTREDDAEKKAKLKEKKKRQAQRKKEAKALEKAAQERAQKKKEEEEAAILAAAHACEACGKKLLGKPSDFFQRLNFFYCSTTCMQRHRREMAAQAAEARLVQK